MKRKPSAAQLAAAHPDVLAAVRRCQRLLRRRALAAAVAGAVPIPGLNWLADAALLARLVPLINVEFGLAPQQIAALGTRQRALVEQTASALGTVLVGKLITKTLLLRLAHTLGLRWSAAQASRYVPIAGQVTGAVLSYTLVRWLGEQHIKDCVRIAIAAQLECKPSPGRPGPVAKLAPA